MPLEVISQRARAAAKPTPVLFVHGAWHGAWCWEYFLPYFAEHGYDAHALSLRGHGRSDGRDGIRWWRIHHYVQDLAEAVRGLAAPPILVGHSMGGLVVQKYLEANTAPAAVLMASVPVSGALGATLRYARRHPVQFLKGSLTLSLYPLVASPSLAREAFFSKAIPDQRLARYFPQIQEESYLAFLDMVAFSLPKPGRVHAPLLILGAGDDMIFTPAEIAATGRSYGVRVEVLPGMAHDMMLEDGWKTVADSVLAWLRERQL